MLEMIRLGSELAHDVLQKNLLFNWTKWVHLSALFEYALNSDIIFWYSIIINNRQNILNIFFKLLRNEVLGSTYVEFRKSLVAFRGFYWWLKLIFQTPD